MIWYDEVLSKANELIIKFFINNKMTRLVLTAKVDTQKQVVNVSKVNNINVSAISPSNLQERSLNEVNRRISSDDTTATTSTTNVTYPGTVCVTPTEENVYGLTEQVSKLTSQNETYKIIVQMFKKNQIYVNQLLIIDDVKLEKLIKLMTDKVNIDSDDLCSGCCTANIYRKVNVIYVIKDNKTINLKYYFPNVTEEIKELGINIKVVW